MTGCVSGLLASSLIARLYCEDLVTTQTYLQDGKKWPWQFRFVFSCPKNGYGFVRHQHSTFTTNSSSRPLTPPFGFPRLVCLSSSPFLSPSHFSLPPFPSYSSLCHPLFRFSLSFHSILHRPFSNSLPLVPPLSCARSTLDPMNEKVDIR